MNRRGYIAVPDFRRINDAIRPSMETILRQLFPNGRRLGQDFVVGSLNGEEGSSLRVCLSGQKAGVWADFATGDKGADIINLIAAAEGCSQSEAARKLAKMAGAN